MVVMKGPLFLSSLLLVCIRVTITQAECDGLGDLFMSDDPEDNNTTLCRQEFKSYYFGSLGAMAFLLLLVMLFLPIVCCLACKLWKIKRYVIR